MKGLRALVCIALLSAFALFVVRHLLRQSGLASDRAGLWFLSQPAWSHVLYADSDTDQLVFAYSTKHATSEAFFEDVEAGLLRTTWFPTHGRSDVRFYERCFPKGDGSEERPDREIGFADVELASVGFNRGKVVVGIYRSKSSDDLAVWNDAPGRDNVWLSRPWEAFRHATGQLDLRWPYEGPSKYQGLSGSEALMTVVTAAMRPPAPPERLKAWSLTGQMPAPTGRCRSWRQWLFLSSLSGADPLSWTLCAREASMRPAGLRS